MWSESISAIEPLIGKSSNGAKDDPKRKNLLLYSKKVENFWFQTEAKEKTGAQQRFLFVLISVPAPSKIPLHYPFTVPTAILPVPKPAVATYKGKSSSFELHQPFEAVR